MIFIYCAILLSLCIFSFFIDVIRNRTEEALKMVCSILLFLPMYGRIFGWW